MRQFRTQAIILNRTDYGEADRIISFLTPDHGKLKAIAKGVRKSKSKLAGGIELFSVSDISFIPGRKDISTVVSTRLIKHYGQIVKDLHRTNTGYELIKKLDKSTEDSPEPEYFFLLQTAFESLDDHALDLDAIILWFDMNLLKLSGHSPDLRTDVSGGKLLPDKNYDFDYERMRFAVSEQGSYGPRHIKLLRLAAQAKSPAVLQKVDQLKTIIKPPLALAQDLARPHR